MDWQGFLEDFSDRLRLTPEQRDVFLASLSDGGMRKSEAAIASDLNLGAGTVKKYMNAVYAAAGREFPSVGAIEGRGKLRELRGFLKNRYRKEEAPAPNFEVPEGGGGRVRQGQG